jgi:hypothetical protein
MCTVLVMVPLQLACCSDTMASMYYAGRVQLLQHDAQLLQFYAKQSGLY